MTTVLLVDDHPVVRSGLRAVIEAGDALTVVGEAATGEEAILLAGHLRPDVVLCDLRLGSGIDGIRTTVALRALDPAPAVLILTTFDRDAEVLGAIEAGAAGYLLKDIDARELARAVHLAAEGSAVIHPDLTRQFINEIRQLTRDEQSVSTLSAREVEVLQMIAYGSTNREVAEALHISPQTVKTYLERIFTKLGVSDRTRAVAVALKHGIVE